MNEYEQRAKLTVDVTSALRDVNKLVSEISAFRSAVADSGKASKVTIDTASATRQLDTITKSVDKLQTSISAVAKDELNLNTAPLDDSLKRLQTEVESLKRSFNELSNSRGPSLNLDNLMTALNTFGSRLEVVLGTELHNLSRRFKNTMSTQFEGAFEHLHAELDQLIDEIHFLAAQQVSLDTDRAKQGVDSLNRSLKDTKNDIMQMQQLQIETKTGASQNELLELLALIEEVKQKSDITRFDAVELNTEVAQQNTQKLIDKLTELQAKIQEIGGSVLDVNVTNKGFDKLINNANKAFRNLERIVQRTSTLMEKETQSAKKTTTEVKRRVSAQTRFNEAVSKGVANLAKGNLASRTISTSLSTGASAVQKIGQTMLKGFYMARGFAELFQQAQGFAYNIGQYITSAGQTILNVITPAVKSLISQGFESASTFESSRIAYQLFFPNENPDEIVKRIQQRAIANPVFDATDLSKYVAQLAPLANGDSQLTIDAIEGIAAMLKASGQEVSTYMQRLVTNTQQVVSTGKATARDWNEFLRATPVFERVLAEVTPALRTKLGNDEAELTKSDTSQLLRALQLVRTDSSISGVLDATAQNFDSLVQQMKESIQTTMGNIVKDTEFYKVIKNWLKEGDRVERLLNSIGRPALEALTRFMNRIDFDELEGIITDTFTIFKQTVQDILDIFGIQQTGFNAKTIREVVKKFVQFVADFIKGWANGIKELISFAQSFLKSIGRDPKDFAFLLGQLASPWGNFMSRAANAVAGFGQLIANFLSLFKGSGGILNQIFALTDINLKEFTGVKRLGLAIKGLAISAVTYAVGQAASELIYEVGGENKNSAQWAGLAEAGSTWAAGTIGGAAVGTSIAPGAGTAIGAVIGTVGGGIIGAITAGDKTNKRIAENTAKTVELLKGERQKKIEEAIPDIAEEALQLYNLKAQQNGWQQIDTNTASGYYAKSQVEQYLKNTAFEDWDLNKMLTTLSGAFSYKTLSEALDEFTNSAEFHNLATGNTWDYKNDSANMGRVAEIIKSQRLLGDMYDYDRSAEEILNSLFSGKDVWSVEQMQAFTKQYEAQRTEADKFNEGVDKVANYSVNTMKSIDVLTQRLSTDLPKNLANLGWAQAMEKLALEIQTLDSNGIKINWNGSTYESESAQETDLEHAVSGLERFGEWIGNLIKGGLGGIFRANGGFIKPVYRASGGGIPARGVDTVPTMLQPGEFVVRKSAVDKFGLPAMSALNFGDGKLAAKLIGRPNITTNSGGNNFSRNNSDNRKSVRQFIQIVNRNNSATLNSYHSLGNRLALGI